MASINRAYMFVVIVLLNVFLQYPSLTNAHDVFDGLPHAPSMHTVQKTLGGLPIEHPMQPSVETLCIDIQLDYANYCSKYFQENANALTLVKLTLDLGEKEFAKLFSLLHACYKEDTPTLKVLYPQMLNTNSSFKEARKLIDYPKLLVNAERMDNIGEFVRLAIVLRSVAVVFRDKPAITKSMEIMKTLFYVLYELTVEVIWTQK